MFTQKRYKNKGFSLLELLIVIAIIGILATIVLLNLRSGRRASRDAKRITDIKAMQTALILYSEDCGAYPIEAVARDVSGLGLDSTCSGWIDAVSGTIHLLDAPPAQQPPEEGCTDVDPPNSNTYWYTSNGGTYTINFCLGSQIAEFGPGAHVLDQDTIQ